MRARLPVVGMFVMAFLFSSALYRVATNLRLGLDAFTDLRREVVVALLLALSAATFMLLWGKTKPATAAVAIFTLIVLTYLPFLVTVRSNAPFDVPVEVLVWSVARTLVITLISLVPVFVAWPPAQSPGPSQAH